MNKNNLLFQSVVIVSLLFSANAFCAGGLISEIEHSGVYEKVAPELKTILILTSLSFIPVILIATTAFTRIIIVLSMLRHALGLQQTPPNTVLLTLALFLTLFTMRPVWEVIDANAIKPFLKEEIGLAAAIEKAETPLKAFMIKQTREEDFTAVIEMSESPMPDSMEDVELDILVPAFLMSELTTAFKMAFVIFIPFLLVDLVVASVLMSLGMIMVPPISIALPIKVMLFVLIDGWSLVSNSIVTSFGT